MFVGQDENDNDFWYIGQTGGKKYVRLTKDDLPEISYLEDAGNMTVSPRSQDRSVIEGTNATIGTSSNEHENMPPYKVVKTQKRTA
jgi:hypothetical protein